MTFSRFPGMNMSTINGFTNKLIDYAGLFPPAGKTMAAVVADYEKYLNGPNRAKLARLIVPASRLAEFEKEAERLLPQSPAESPWTISALVPACEPNNGEFGFAISGIQQFNARHADSKNGLAVVDVIEIATPTVEHVKRTIGELPDTLLAFMEIPSDSDPGEQIRQIAESGQRQRHFAKIRTGGVAADLIPPPAQVARFIHACAENLVGFKATAGLHHPLRSEFKLTYASDSPSATMHGFVNVFVAACFAFANSIGTSDIESILKLTSPDEFQFGKDELVCQDRRISARKVARIREEFAISFGSCSFDEPTAELVELGFEQSKQGLTSAV
jgi:hypothetical protein